MEDGYKTWFHFSVHGVPQGEQLTFTFKNLNNQTKLYSQGLKPVFRVLPSTQKKWRRIFQKVNYFFNCDDQFTLRFNHMFSNQPNETTYFAFSYPFSYQESQNSMDEIQNNFEAAAPINSNLYFHRETVYYSIEGRKMEMMTISSKDGITEDREPIPEGNDYNGIFPEGAKDPNRRPLKFGEKPIVVFTSRVHTGETPGSHVLNGLIDLITDLKSE
jgi:cytosolic carboxypeptidase protein 5